VTDPATNERSITSARFRAQDLLLPANRGLLLDIAVFLVNLLLMRFLLGRFVNVIRLAVAGDFVSELAMFFFVLALLVLPPVGATLKRWRFHERTHFNRKAAGGEETFSSGCLFNPILYFCLNIVVFSVLNAFIFQYFYGDNEPGGLFVGSIFLGLTLVIIQTYLVYRFFSPPKKEPWFAFLRNPKAELLGDVFIFIEVLFYQLLWNLITLVPFGRVGSVSEFFGRLFWLTFIALLIYFPPRIFYLADDIGKRRRWLMILIANLPVIVKVLIGTSSDANWQ